MDAVGLDRQMGQGRRAQFRCAQTIERRSLGTLSVPEGGEGGEGGGVRATRGFQVGGTVMVGVLGGEVARNDSHATQVSRTKWARHGGLGPKVNRSCSPNCGVELNEIDGELAASVV